MIRAPIGAPDADGRGSLTLQVQVMRNFRLRTAVGALWEVLPPAGRVALAGLVASAAIALALGIFIPAEIKRHLLIAEARGLEAAVDALAPALPDLTHGALTPEELEATERLVDRALLDRGELMSMERLVSDAEQDLRAFMNRVRPMSLERVGLVAALQDVVARFRQETHIHAAMRGLG